MSSFPYLEVGGGGEGLRSLKRINQGHILDKCLAYPLGDRIRGNQNKLNMTLQQL
jgi:hypothetical protein